MKYSLLVLEIVLATAAVAISMDPSDIPPGRGLGTAGSPNNTAFLRTPDGLRRPRCIHAGGFCVRRGRKCNGISDRRQCIGKKYKCCVERNACSHWSYPSTNWPLICPAYCSGIRQSPINIVTLPKLPIASGLFTLFGYGSTIPTVDIENNGHTVTVSWDTNTYPSISGGGLVGDYTLVQFHFHWGCNNSKGSEHTVDGYRYPMEMHFVHYKTSYGNLTNALKYIDGLAVLGVFFKVGAANAALQPITDNLYEITTPAAEKTNIPFGVKLSELLPNSYDHFYRYRGSLTTPTCNQVVIWSVIVDHLELSQDQLDEFRSLEDLHGGQLCDNYRYVQPLNGRIVQEYN